MIRFGPHMLFPDSWNADRDWDEPPEEDPCNGYQPVTRPDDDGEPADEEAGR